MQNQFSYSASVTQQALRSIQFETFFPSKIDDWRMKNGPDKKTI